MLMGNEEVSIRTLIELMESKSKLAHGLVKTDIEPSVPICDTLTFCPIGHPSSYIDGDRCCTFSLC